MKFLIVLSCTLVLASAGYPYYHASHYAQHYPVIDHNGVPVETPEVQAAKAHHFAAHAAASHGAHHDVVPYYGHQAHYGYQGHYGYLPKIAADGTPLDTPEVEHAKAAHFSAYHKAAARNGVYGHDYGHHYAAVPHVFNSLGPVDTHEVQLAKAAHFAAHAEAKAHSGHHHYRKRREAGYGYPQHIPVIGHNGVPIDTPEVQAAKAHHLAAHAQLSSVSHNAVVHAAPYAEHYDEHYNEHYTPKYTGPIHIPVIGPHGVPVETPEVQAAKAEHLASHAKLGGGTPYVTGYSAPHTSVVYGSAPVHATAYYGHGLYGNGAPVDTHEVQAAKAAHLAAHAQASGHHYY